MKRKTTVLFTGTKEQEEQLCMIIKEVKGERGSLIPIMQKAQEIYGYLPAEVQKIIADHMEIPMEEVYGAATYYSDFRLNPKGKYKLTVCLGTACQMNGANQVYDKLKELLGIEENECTQDLLFSLEERHCVGSCAMGPVLMVNDKIYGKMTPDKVEEIVNRYQEADSAGVRGAE